MVASSDRVRSPQRSRSARLRLTLTAAVAIVAGGLLLAGLSVVGLSVAGMNNVAVAGTSHAVVDRGHDSPGEFDRPQVPHPDTDLLHVPISSAGLISVTSDTTFTLAGSPYTIADTLVIEDGVDLTIEPGVVVKMGNDAMLVVWGDIFAVGTPVDRITFEPLNAGDRWISVGLLWIDTTAEIRYCDFRGGSRGAYEGLALLGLVGWFFSDIQITDCTFEDGTKHGLSGVRATGLVARNTIMDMDDEDIDSNFNEIDIIDNLLFSPNADADVLDYNESVAPALIQGNVIIAGLDDGIDLDSFIGTVFGNVISNCSDKGVSMSRSSADRPITQVTATNNMVDNCLMAFGITNGSIADIWNNTLVNSGTGVRAFEKNQGFGGVTVTGTNNIVWGHVDAVFADAVSSVTLTYSDVQGTDVYPGVGNINADPIFAGAADFHLAMGSPCIDAGDSDGAPELDFEADIRYDDLETPDTGTGTLGSFYDMGADEFWPTTSVLVSDTPARPTLVRVTPNPVHRAGSIKIELGSGEVAGTLRLFDVQGRQLRVWEGVRGDRALDWDGRTASGELLARGVYFLDFVTPGSSEHLNATIAVLR